jgi:TPP-dependent pyruvate/acetoin dehydrogenase alpha subunit
MNQNGVSSTGQAERRMGMPDTRTMIRDMVRIRCIEEVLGDIYRDEQEMRTPAHFSIGQEAVAVGTAAALRADDAVFSSHRCHAHYLAKGGDLGQMVAELYGRESGLNNGRGGSMRFHDPDLQFTAAAILGEMIAFAVGAAWTFSRQASGRVAVTFFGDGAAEEGVLHESLNFASSHKLPVVFACENNGYSMSSPLSARQPAGTSIWQRAATYGMPSAEIDGNDVEAVVAGCQQAVDWCRAGSGPYFLEFSTYRWREHVGPNWDHDAGYRTKQEIDSWLERCPIQLAAQSLMDRAPGIRQDVEGWEQEFRRSTLLAVAEAKASPFPDVSTICDGVYANR